MDFKKDQTTFWGILAASFWFGKEYLKYKTASMKQKEIDMEKVGIKETKEALDGLNALAVEIVSVVKDGIQVSDAAKIVEDLLLNPEFKAKLSAAVDGIGKIPSEIKDIDLEEGVELIKLEYDGVKNIIEALKK